MKSQSKIILIGDIVVDVTLKTSTEKLKLRMGGIVHAARGLWALNIPYTVAYFAPNYLDDQIKDYLFTHGCVEVIKIGEVTGAPYVFLINEAKEVGDQGYDFLLREEIKITYFHDEINRLIEKQYEDIFLISGNYNQIDLINKLNGNIHIDIANNVQDLSIFETLNKKINTLFLSTSSSVFKEFFAGDFETFVSLFEPYSAKLILKENRGGSRGIEFSTKETFSASAQSSKIKHSIGVGDVFDVCFIVSQSELGNSYSIALSSWVAFEYALTTFPDDFKKNVERLKKIKLDELIKLRGVLLPWEDRIKINIYIAAPDFDFIDTRYIDNLCESLMYHNFKPRRPIRENGQMENNASKIRKQEIYNKDIALLNECSILIAVLLFNDPGTLIEIGLASAMGIPTIIFDPYSLAENCMLTESPSLVSNDLDEILTEVFIISNKINANG